MPKLVQKRSCLLGRWPKLDKVVWEVSSARELLKTIMGTILQQNLGKLRGWVFVVSYVLSSSYGQAHPGHEGGHEGDEFVWTSASLGGHLLATLLLAALGGLIVWSAVRGWRATQRQLKAVANRNPAADKTV